ncbi:MAG: SDR family NAD(P)-dependent oxidoreductase [Mongoliibacter sp.]|uniref:SDR family NAD(P)-dependent oxidoreductase n=1 Tax=Mongoliibacter sp. TaxID=2022438 RepID=UPI0012F10842|nr:SDR family NAD(P)-dependent oxidoreductase [Mongoliibacter sp.]TVP51800.1 MAG: SDR family NAD(P)-dependent oxidoreductase [Mongoliibacter sp.]
MKALFIITGSSKGIGKGIVSQLLQNKDNHVIGIARSEQDFGQQNFESLQIDLSKVKDIEAEIERIFPEGNFSKIVLINNAGWIGPISHIGNMNSENIQTLFDLNVVAPMVLMNAFVERYAGSSSEKTVVNISSGASKKAIDGWSGYSSSKAALNMMTEAAQVEADLDENGIRYFALAPGVVDTKMQSDIRGADEKSFSKLEKFLNLKSNNQLSTTEAAAEKIIYLIENRDEFEGVFQDVREF